MDLRRNDRSHLESGTHHALEVLVVGEGAENEGHEHRDGNGLSLPRGLVIFDRFEQEIQKHRRGKLRGVVDELEGNGL